MITRGTLFVQAQERIAELVATLGQPGSLRAVGIRRIDLDTILELAW